MGTDGQTIETKNLKLWEKNDAGRDFSPKWKLCFWSINCILIVWSLVADIEGGTQAEGVWE